MALNINAYFDKISKLKMIYRIVIFAGTIALLVGLYIWTIHIPKTAEIATIKSEMDRLDKDIRIAKLRAKNLNKLEMNLAKIQQDLKAALKLLPTKSEIPSLLKSITKLGNDSNLEFLLFSPEKEVSKGFYLEIPVGIEVRGIYHNVATFFDKVGKLDRIVNVVNVSMTPIKEYSTTLNIRCKALTYRFKEEAKADDVQKKTKKKK
jgi:type IV pilus assembly protein PilO